MNYTDSNRGVIQNREQAKQLIDFHGVRYGNITPTDIDGFFEYHDRVFVFYEMKRNGNEMPHGQCLALHRLVDALWRDGKFAILFKCDHDVTNPSNDIDAANTIVKTLYYNGFELDGKGRTAKQITDEWMKFAAEYKHPYAKD